jgi:hypothetical protein
MCSITCTRRSQNNGLLNSMTRSTQRCLVNRQSDGLAIMDCTPFSTCHLLTWSKWLDITCHAATFLCYQVHNI